MLKERVFHFKRANAVAGRVDHIIAASREPEIAVCIALAAVARQEPAAVRALDETAFCFLGLFPIAEHHLRIGHPDSDMAFLLRPKSEARFINDIDIGTGGRSAHGAVLDRFAWIIEDKHQPFRLTVGLVHPDTRRVLPFSATTGLVASPEETVRLSARRSYRLIFSLTMR